MAACLLWLLVVGSTPPTATADQPGSEQLAPAPQTTVGPLARDLVAQAVSSPTVSSPTVSSPTVSSPTVSSPDGASSDEAALGREIRGDTTMERDPVELEASWQFVRGKLLADQGNFEEALEAYRRSVELDDSDPYNLLEAARFHTYLSQVSSSRQQQLTYLEQGLLYIDRARQLDADNPDVLELYAQMHMRLVEERPASLALAQGAFQRLRELEPGNLTALTSLGQIYLWEKNGEKAVEVLKEASRYNPSNRMIQSMLVEALLGTGKSEDAEAALVYLVRLEPRDSENRLRLAELYSERGDHVAAVEVLEEAPEGDWFGTSRIRQLLAREYHLAGRNSKALFLTDQLLAEGTNAQASEGFRRLRSAILSALLRYEEALESFAPILESAPPSSRRSQDVLLMSRLYERLGRSDEATEVLREELASSADDDAAQIRLALAGLLQRVGKLAEAQTHILPMIEEGGSNGALAARVLAELRQQEGRLGEALAGLESAAKARDAAGEPALARALDLRRAVILADAEQWTALEGLTRALLESEVPGAALAARQFLADALAGQGRLEQAVDLLKVEAGSSTPDGSTPDGPGAGETPSDGNLEASAGGGVDTGTGSADSGDGGPSGLDRRLLAKRFQLLYEHGSEAQAIAELEELAAASAEGDLYFVARLYQSLELHNEATPLLVRVSEAEPERLDVLFALGAAYERSGKNAEAEEAFGKLLELRPEHPAALNYLGYMWAERGENLDRALEMIRKAVSQDPDNGAYVDSLGWAYYQRKEYDQARPHLEWAARLQPDDPTVHEHLGDLYVALGDAERARRAYEKALELEDSEAETEKVETLRRKLEGIETPAGSEAR